jgi:ABC-type uncharacterized transport system permease subunit
VAGYTASSTLFLFLFLFFIFYFSLKKTKKTAVGSSLRWCGEQPK